MRFFVCVLNRSIYLSVFGYAGSSCGSGASSGCGGRGLWSTDFSSRGARASLLLGVWNLPGPGIEPIPLHWPVDSHPLCHQGSPEVAVLLNSLPNVVLTCCLCRCRNLARVSVDGTVCVPTRVYARGLNVIPGSEYCMSASQPASQPHT